MRFASQATFFALIVSLTSVLGFGREIIIARDFGASMEMDSFIAAFAIVSFIGAILSPQTIQPMFMPAYQDALKKGGTNASEMFNNMALLMGGILLIISILGYLLAGYIVKVLMPGFSLEQLHLTKDLMRMMLPIIALSGLISLAHALSNSHGSFLFPIFTQTCNNIVVIILLLAMPAASIHSLAHYYVLGCIAASILLFFAMIRFVPSRKINLSNRHYLDNFSLTWPLLIVAMMDQAVTLLPRSFASTLAHGDITSLNIAFRLTTLPVSIIAAAIVSVLFPRIISHVRDIPDMAIHTLRTASNVMLYCLVPITVFICIESHAIVDFLFSSDQFNEAAVTNTASALRYYSLGIIGLGYLLFLNRVYSAYRAYWFYVRASIIAFICLAILIPILIIPLAHNGIALAFSLVCIVKTFGLLIHLRKFGLARIVSYHSLLYLTIASAVSSLILLSFPTTSFALLCVKATLSISGFYLCLWLLRDCVLKNTFNELKSK